MPDDWNELLSSAHAWWLRAEPPREDRTELVRRMLSYYTGVSPDAWNFGRSEYGKPFVQSPPEFASLQFNFSHTPGMMVCIVSRVGGVGIDVEDTSRASDADVEELIQNALSPVEQARLFRLDPDARRRAFHELWVLKEAFLKARGEGLNIEPSELTIELDIDGFELKLHEIDTNHLAATAVSRPCSVVWRNGAALL